MLKIGRMWNCRRGDTYFNDIFCVCGDQERAQIGCRQADCTRWYSVMFGLGIVAQVPLRKFNDFQKRGARVSLTFNCFIRKMYHWKALMIFQVVHLC